MYYDFDSYIVRYLMRKARKEQDLRQEDVADDEMSYGTISNIERGIPNVKEKSIERYLAKLGLTLPRLRRLVKKEQAQIDELTFRLETIESMLDNDILEKAEQLLKEVSLESFHPLAPFKAYLEGRLCQERKNWKRAEKHYKLAIRLTQQYNLNTRQNLVAACYNELSICAYKQNNLDKARQYADTGLEECDEITEADGTRYPLVSNKILYLLDAQQYDAAHQTLEEVWRDKSRIDNIHVALNLHKFRAVILRKMGRYSEAADICTQGIAIARRNRIQNFYLDLITVLGSIYLLQKKIDAAKLRFEAVLDYDYASKFPRSRIDSLAYLAIIYSHENDWDKAEDLIQNALELSRKISQVYRLSKVLIIAGNIYLKQNKLEKAVQHYQEAEEISEKSGHKQRQYSALLNMVHCFDKMNEEDRWTHYMKKLVKLQREINLKSEDEVYAI